MQREIIHGVPYFLDSKQQVYLWEPDASPCAIGSYDKQSKQLAFREGLLPSLQDRLAKWRSEQQPRARKPTKRRGTSSSGATQAEASESDE
jgi:hypothetical protein